ncbi:putative short-chain dehydrogenase [Xylariaceae sp. FL1651]|nr:putative short-chain dehydrogenase [Xylariaceae sp. FL1651]
MVQFNGPYGKVPVSYLRNGGYNPPAEPTKTFEGKTVLITGCSSGIGYEAALKVASLKPKKLILGNRTLAKAEVTKAKILAHVPSLDASVIEILPVEYTSFASVSQFTEAVKRSTLTLDGVILSVGVAQLKYEPVEDGWETTIKVNVLSAALVAVELLPLLRATPGSVLEFVTSISYCNVTSLDVAPLIEDPSASALKFFNDPGRWTTQRGYYEAKMMLMFVLQGLVESLGGSQGKLGDSKSPVLLACCPGQCKTDLYRNFPFAVRLFMFMFNAIIARTAEQGSRTLVTGIMQHEKANGRMWVNDQFDDWSPGLTEQEWSILQKRVWAEVRSVLKAYKPELAI